MGKSLAYFADYAEAIRARLYPDGLCVICEIYETLFLNPRETRVICETLKF